MADWCTKCSEHMFPSHIGPDIDVEKEFNKLDDNMMQNGFLCEGCTLNAIANDNGVMKVAYLNTPGDYVVWEDYKESWKEHYGKS